MQAEAVGQGPRWPGEALLVRGERVLGDGDIPTPGMGPLGTGATAGSAGNSSYSKHWCTGNSYCLLFHDGGRGCRGS